MYPEQITEKNLEIASGLSLSCEECVLSKRCAGTKFSHYNSNGEIICNFCFEHREPTFLGSEQLIQDLNLGASEQIGITVSGGKDSMYVWMKLVDLLGSDKVVAFNHHKVGLVHPIAKENLAQAEKILGSELIQFSDTKMLPRFRKNLLLC